MEGGGSSPSAPQGSPRGATKHGRRREHSSRGGCIPQSGEPGPSHSATGPPPGPPPCPARASGMAGGDAGGAWDKRSDRGRSLSRKVPACLADVVDDAHHQLPRRPVHAHQQGVVHDAQPSQEAAVCGGTSTGGVSGNPGRSGAGEPGPTGQAMAGSSSARAPRRDGRLDASPGRRVGARTRPGALPVPQPLRPPHRWATAAASAAPAAPPPAAQQVSPDHSARCKRAKARGPTSVGVVRFISFRFSSSRTAPASTGGRQHGAAPTRSDLAPPG